LSVLVLITAAYYVPIKFDITISNFSIAKDYLKLIIVFIFLLVGFNIKNPHIVITSIKYYSYTSLIIGVFGIILTIFNLTSYFSFFYYGDIRYKGFLNDPNYFAIIQASSIPYFMYNYKLKNIIKIFIVSLLFLSIILSGSKTGFIVITSYLLFFLIKYICKYYIKGFFITVLLLTIFLCRHSIIIYFKLLAEVQPSFERIYLFLNNLINDDLADALNDGGSSREFAWELALEIISSSPIVGVGIGTYIFITEKFVGIALLAHNSFLQLFAEWGIVFASMFYIYLIFVIYKSQIRKDKDTYILRVTSGILIIFLLGSFAISLNNARMFWFFLGINIYYLFFSKQNL
jgi:hypothetical protein